jgi:hypothetical protein
MRTFIGRIQLRVGCASISISPQLTRFAANALTGRISLRLAAFRLSVFAPTSMQPGSAIYSCRFERSTRRGRTHAVALLFKS